MNPAHLKQEFRELLNNITTDFERLEGLSNAENTDFELFVSNLDALYKKGIIFAYSNSIATNLQTTEAGENKVVENPIAFSGLLKEAEIKQIENTVVKKIETTEKELFVETKQIEEQTTVIADLKEEFVVIENPIIEETIAKIAIEPEVTKEPILNLADIKSSIGINDKFQFISELFANNVDIYESAIKRLNTNTTLTSSLSTLEEIKKENNWKDESEAGQRFSEIIKRRFL